MQHKRKSRVNFGIFLLFVGLASICGVEAFHSTRPNYISNIITQKKPTVTLNVKQIWDTRKKEESSSVALSMFRGDKRPSWMTPSRRTTCVYVLILSNIFVFLFDKIWKNFFVRRHLYLVHSRWKWWQLFTNCFCHANTAHLSNSLFLLLLFGRAVEDDIGWRGLLFSYLFCAILSSVASLLVLPKSTVTIGASGAVFGLYTLSTLGKLASTTILDWRGLLEFAIMGDFVFRTSAIEVSRVVKGGIGGVPAHLSGAAAGALLVFVMRAAVDRYDRSSEVGV